ncbi:metallophosphoesterase family protein [Pseudooceanicola aestuarii]|uniref:metallophosphoesterase family protein n=1 Tax=Pseudooceanicola aestuarii TaxID=2697319 RepID=UPI0013D0CA43|nr:metallophosphoesterase [Pseudooceanicola aestuarii]
MDTFSLIQISDTHLSRERPDFVPNFAIAADHIATAKPDLVVHTGDIAVEATARADDLVHGREAMEALGTPYRCIPGNHDVGDNPSDHGYVPEKRVSDPLVDTYEALFGPGHWHLDMGGWRLIGLNAQLFSSGLARATVQQDWLADTLADSDGRPVAIFCHKPLLRDALEEPVDVPYRYVPLADRGPLAQAMAGADVRLFACGHVHQARDHRVGDTRHIWCPATAFTMPDEMQPRVGDKRCGLTEYRFSPMGVDVQMQFPAAMTHPDVAVLRSVYAV